MSNYGECVGSTVAMPDQSSQAEQAVSDLWRFYDEHAAQARQHENLRATVTSILTAFAAALVGFASSGGLHRSDAPAGALVIVLGVLGALLSLKHYERNRFHVRVMGAVRKEVTRLRRDPARVPQTTKALRDGAEEKHKREFFRPKTCEEGKERSEEREDDPEEESEKGSWLVRLSLYQLWAALDLAVAAVGAIIVAISLA